jgi:hypothetical protein
MNNLLRILNTLLLAGILATLVLIFLHIREPLQIDEPISIQEPISVQGVEKGGIRGGGRGPVPVEVEISR